jgi:hypothetical protein
MKKKDYLTPHMEVVDVNTEHVLLAGSMGINAGDTGIIDGGGGDEPALSPLFGSELDNELFL